MSYDEKNAWAFGIVAVGTYIAYVLVIVQRAAGAPLSDVDYQWPMVGAIVAAIVLGIVAAIVIAITSPKDAGVRDVRDREINRRGEYAGQSFVVVGGTAVIVLAMVEAPYFWIANAMYLAFIASAVLSTIVKLAGYRWGLPE